MFRPQHHFYISIYTFNIPCNLFELLKEEKHKHAAKLTSFHEGAYVTTGTYARFCRALRTAVSDMQRERALMETV